MRATQLYSVVDIAQIAQTPPPAAAITTTVAPLTNPFEISQEKLPEEQPSIDVHITETVHLLSKGGIVEKSGIWGEISIDYNGPSNPETPILLRLDHNLEKLEPTEFASRQTDDSEFKINTELFTNQRHVCIKYQTKLDTVPLVVKPMWKCDADKSRLLVKYNNPTQQTLHNVVFMTSVTGNVQNALSIPAGELVLAQKVIKWHLGSVDQDSVIKAQFSTLEQGTPQPIAIRFDMQDTLLSNLQVNGPVKTVTRSVKTGKYLAEM